MLRDFVSDAIRDARANWLRVLLTSSGVVWGIALFLTMLGSGIGIRAHLKERMEAIGRKVVFVFPGTVTRPHASSKSARSTVLERADARRIERSPLVERAAGELWLGPRVMKARGVIKSVWTVGDDAEAGRIRNFVVERGRFLSTEDVAKRRRVLVIGAKVEQRLFGRRSALGLTLHLQGYPFRVIGVSAEKGEQMINMLPAQDDEQAILPISTAQYLFTGKDELQHVLYDPITRADAPASMQRVRALLSSAHGFRPAQEESLSFFNLADVIKLADVISAALQIFLAACGVMTLIAGAVGVMNTMLVAVAERTRELGLRKAIGATDRDLFLHVLVETVVITVGAGLIGLLLGTGFIRLLQWSHDQTQGKAQFLAPRITLSWELALLSFAVLVGTGVIAGILPALSAARLDPAVALRDE